MDAPLNRRVTDSALKERKRYGRRSGALLSFQSHKPTAVKLPVDTEARLGNFKTQEDILVFSQGFIQAAASAILNSLITPDLSNFIKRS